MNKTLSLILVVLAILIGVGGVLLGVTALKKAPKIVYVNNFKVFENYNGFKDAYNRIEVRKGAMKQNLEFRLKTIEDLRAKHAETGGEVPQNLKESEQSFVETRSQFEQQIKEYEQSQTDSLYAVVNLVVEEYAQSEGVDYVLGINGDGSIVYAAEGNDITDLILKELNEKY
ncbi:MAG: hypothetical protein CL843_14485 [Crocinitomicaceae bacterium]|nr:hypothetical protein [Crocinitomicaceae bacterium]|tara:strand:+ start:2791 stop:3306 length:516 start_codon:yes stop_codon:yes gene_type:complete